MAVGDCVMDKTQPPPMLSKALNYEKWGIPDIMQLPAGMLPQINVCLNYYHALQGYKSAAGKTSAWSKSNPQAWEMVSYVLAERMERASGNRNQ